jgi:hypothetical protein
MLVPLLTELSLFDICKADNPTTGDAAACSNEILPGLMAMSLSLTTIYSDSAPPLKTSNIPNTSSPFLKLPIVFPVFSITPEKSIPTPFGNLDPDIIFISPLNIFQSKGLIETAFTLTRISFPDIGGTAVSTNCKTSVLPN